MVNEPFVEMKPANIMAGVKRAEMEKRCPKRPLKWWKHDLLDLLEKGGRNW